MPTELSLSHFKVGTRIHPNGGGKTRMKVYTWSSGARPVLKRQVWDPSADEYLFLSLNETPLGVSVDGEDDGAVQGLGEPVEGACCNTQSCPEGEPGWDPRVNRS